MKDIRLNKLAKLLVNYSVKVKPGQKVHLIGWPSAEPLFRELYKETLLAGGFPTMRIRMDEEDYLLYKYGSPEQIGAALGHD